MGALKGLEGSSVRSWRALDKGPSNVASFDPHILLAGWVDLKVSGGRLSRPSTANL